MAVCKGERHTSESAGASRTRSPDKGKWRELVGGSQYINSDSESFSKVLTLLPFFICLPTHRDTMKFDIILDSCRSAEMYTDNTLIYYVCLSTVGSLQELTTYF